MSDGIAYQNKDILLKILSEAYKEKSFSAYGINLPPIKEVLPTNLPRISADEKVMDNLFLLEDGTYVIVDYESVYKRQNKIKYLNYIARVMEKYFTDDSREIRLRLIIIYTGDVESADAVFETDCITLRTEQAFLSNIPGDLEYDKIKRKIETHEFLTDEDSMRLIILPLTQKGVDEKQKMIEKVIDLTEQIVDTNQKIFILSGVIVASDKFIDKGYLEMIRRRIDMTKLGQLYEKEKIEYGNERARKAALMEKYTIAQNLLDQGLDIVDIMKATGLTEAEILSLKAKQIV